VLKISEVAERLNLSPSKVYEIVAGGKLIAHRFDGSLRISEEDLQSYIESCRASRPCLEPPKQSRLKHLSQPSS